jgi:hypothetical protein
MLKLRQRLSLRFLMKRNYKLSPYLDAAYKAANPNHLRKILSKPIKGKLNGVSLEWQNFEDFPIPNDPNNKWVSSLELNEAD